MPSCPRWRFAAPLLLAALGLAETACAGDPPARPASRDGFSAGVEIRPEARAADIGLPVYPGAVPQRDKGDDQAGVTMGLWGGSFGFRLVVLKFASTDSMEAVASYYRDALGRYGAVIDCSQPAPAPSAARGALSCEGDKAEPGGHVYKVGTTKRQRVVGMKQVGNLVHFQLVRMEATGD